MEKKNSCGSAGSKELVDLTAIGQRDLVQGAVVPEVHKKISGALSEEADNLLRKSKSSCSSLRSDQSGNTREDNNNDADSKDANETLSEIAKDGTVSVDELKEDSEAVSIGLHSWRERLKLVIPHVTLVVATILYALLGGGLFYYIERPNERNIKTKNAEVVKNLQQRLLHHAWNITEERTATTHDAFEADINQRLDKMVEATFQAFKVGLNDDGIVDPGSITLKWTYPSAVFFSTTVITTIGYGNLVPVTFWGRVLCIVYALLGIPLALITIADIGKFVGQLIVKTYDQYQVWKIKYCRRKRRFGIQELVIASVQSFTGHSSERESKMKEEEEKAEEEESEVDISEALETRIPASLVLLILLSYTAISAVVFGAWEDWEFINSFYFSFITMATVGFGDLVPTRESYLFLAIFFIVFGLVLTTMSIDLVGTHYIRQIHFMGRKIKDARQALALLGDKAGTVGDWWKHIKNIQTEYGLTDDEIRKMMMNVNGCRGFIQAHQHAFIPNEAALMAYIDNVPSSEDRFSLMSCLEL